MATRPTVRLYRRSASGTDVLWEQSEGTYGVSPRGPDGQLRLKANACELNKCVVTSWHQKPGANGTWVVTSGAAFHGITDPRYGWQQTDNQAYSKFWGKVRKGSASMGVTLASWKQSRDMIVTRSRKTSVNLEDAYRKLKGDKKKLSELRRRREDKELLADDVLETQFGWKPLFEDMHSALFTVCKDGIPPEWMTSRGKSNQRWIENFSTDFQTDRTVCNARVSTTYSAKVQISNPNLWLLNRMGLINPATVAWDLIPWSFVVNMFLNVNTMINSVTNEVGLNVSDYSITRSSLVYYEKEKISKADIGAVCRNNALGRWKSRTLGTPLLPNWQVTVPELNWGLAVTAASLVVQKFKKINNLLGI